MHLSDLFLKEAEDLDIELKCTVYNINTGNNETLMQKSKILNDYTSFVEKVREYQYDEIEHPIETAMDYCIAHEILKDFLTVHYDEVLKSMTLDMTFEAREKLIRRDSFEEGIEQGRLAVLKAAIQGGMNKESIIGVLKFSEDEYEAAIKEAE